MSMEMKPGMIADPEQARIAANAEKPIRDLAREKNVSPQEKEILDRLAERKGEEAIENYIEVEEKNESKEPQKKSIPSRNNEKSSSVEKRINNTIEVLTNVGFSDPKGFLDKLPQLLGSTVNQAHIQSKLDELKELGFENPIRLIESRPTILTSSVENNIKSKIDFLISLGVSDPIGISEGYPALLGLSIEENMKPKIESLKALGFSDVKKLIEVAPSILGLSIEENLIPRLEYLRKLGFSDPVAFIEKEPSLLRFSIKENLEPKLEALKALGIDDPVKLAEKSANFLKNTTETIKEKLEALKELGFSDPIKLLKKDPNTLTLSIEKNIKPKLEAMREMGFPYPARVLESNASLMGLSVDTIKSKLHGIQMLGFENATSLIEKNPSLLGLSIEKNIRPKIKLLTKVFEEFQLRADPIKVVEASPFILGLKYNRLIVTMRAIHDYVSDWQEITESQIGVVTMSSLEDVLVASMKIESPVPMREFIGAIAQVRKQKLSKDEKQKLILAYPSRKIKDLYEKTYGKGQDQGESKDDELA